MAHKRLAQSTASCALFLSSLLCLGDPAPVTVGPPAVSTSQPTTRRGGSTGEDDKTDRDSQALAVRFPSIGPIEAAKDAVARHDLRFLACASYGVEIPGLQYDDFQRYDTKDVIVICTVGDTQIPDPMRSVYGAAREYAAIYNAYILGHRQAVEAK